MAGNRNVVLGNLKPCWDGDADACLLEVLNPCAAGALEDVRVSKLLVDFLCGPSSPRKVDISDNEWFWNSGDG